MKIEKKTKDHWPHKCELIPNFQMLSNDLVEGIKHTKAIVFQLEALFYQLIFERGSYYTLNNFPVRADSNSFHNDLVNFTLFLAFLPNVSFSK